jgi:hypothetical protein
MAPDPTNLRNYGSYRCLSPCYLDTDGSAWKQRRANARVSYIQVLFALVGASEHRTRGELREGLLSALLLVARFTQGP